MEEQDHQGLDIEVRDWLLEVETKDKETKNMSQAEIRKKKTLQKSRI